MWLLSGRCSSKARLDGKTAVITGCNTGIGKFTAQDFVTRGCRVIMACRDVGKAEKAAEDIRKATAGVSGVGVLVVVPLDLSSFESIRECAKELMKTEHQINLLINNAGLGVAPKTVTADGFELLFGVNHLGPFLFTLLLLPRLLNSTPARIVMVASVLHLFGNLDFDDINMEKSYSTSNAYNRSKLANVLFAKELSNRLLNRGVTTYSLHPGAVNTEINRNMDSAWCPGMEWIFTNVLGLFYKTPEQGAQTTIYCAVDEKAGEQTGQYYSDCKKSTASSKARDSTLATRLWEESVKMVGLDNFDPFTAEDRPPPRQLQIPEILINETPLVID